MTLAELGAQFREARVHRGLLVDDVAKSIKLSVKIIRAIEDGAREDLPELVFLRGFIKTYGLFLGFSSTDLQKALDYLDANEPKTSPRDMSVLDKYVPNQHGTYIEKKKSGSPFLYIILLLVLVGGAGAIYYFAFSEKETEIAETSLVEETVAESSQQEPVEEKINELVSQIGDSESTEESVVIEQENTETLTEDTPIDIDTTNQNIETTIDTSNQEELETVLDEEKVEPTVENIEEPLETVVETPTVEEIEVTEEADTTKEIPQNFSATYGSGSKELVLVALDDCWMRIDVDKSKVRRSFVLEKGTKIKINFNNSTEITFGNAGGVEVYYNETNKGAPGARGEVITVTYP